MGDHFQYHILPQFSGLQPRGSFAFESACFDGVCDVASEMARIPISGERPQKNKEGNGAFNSRQTFFLLSSISDCSALCTHNSATLAFPANPSSSTCPAECCYMLESN